VSTEGIRQVAPQQRKVVVERLYRALVNGELLPRSLLGAETRLSGTVLGDVLRDLEARAVIEPRRATDPGIRGPKRDRYALRPDRGHVLALGFGHDRLGVALTDLSGAHILRHSDYIDPDPQPGRVEGDPTSSLARAIKEANAMLDGLDRERELVGVGVSLPAPLMEDSRIYAGFMDAWQSRDIEAELQNGLRLPDWVPVAFDNDANLIARRELRRGAARGATHACVVKWGSGLGAGLIIEGRVYRGPRGLAGEIGHVTTAPAISDPLPEGIMDLLTTLATEDRQCRRCRQMCLEALISTQGLLAYLNAKGTLFPNIAAAIDAALAGQHHAREAFRQAAHLLGHKLGPIISAMNLQHLVLDCFADPRAYPLVVDGLRQGLEHRMTPAAHQQLTVKAATCGETAAILGAVDLVLDRHLAHWVNCLSRLDGAGFQAA